MIISHHSKRVLIGYDLFAKQLFVFSPLFRTTKMKRFCLCVFGAQWNCFMTLFGCLFYSVSLRLSLFFFSSGEKCKCAFVCSLRKIRSVASHSLLALSIVCSVSVSSTDDVKCALIVCMCFESMKWWRYAISTQQGILFIEYAKINETMRKGRRATTSGKKHQRQIVSPLALCICFDLDSLIFTS